MYPIDKEFFKFWTSLTDNRFANCVPLVRAGLFLFRPCRLNPKFKKTLPVNVRWEQPAQNGKGYFFQPRTLSWGKVSSCKRVHSKFIRWWPGALSLDRGKGARELRVASCEFRAPASRSFTKNSHTFKLDSKAPSVCLLNTTQWSADHNYDVSMTQHVFTPVQLSA